MMIKGYKESEEGIIFSTDEDMVLKVKPVSPQTVRIWKTENITGKEKSYSVSKDLPVYPYMLEEKEDYWLVKMQELVIRVWKQGLQIDFLDPKEGQTIAIQQNLEKKKEEYLLQYKLEREEHFYGLGEDNDAFLGNLDRKGTVRELITGQRINVGHVTADIPVSFLLSTGKGGSPYGIFVDNTYRQVWDIGAEDAEKLTIKADGGDAVYYFFKGKSFDDIVGEYISVTGRSPMPPLWTLGFIQSKCSYKSWEEVEELIDEFERRQIPLDGIVFDYDWAEGFNNYRWNDRFEGKSPEKIAEYREQGLHFMVSNSGPMIREDSSNYQSMLEHDLYAKGPEGKPVICGHYGGSLMDFTHPEMKEWLKKQLFPVLDDGIEGWWLDLTEPEGEPAGTKYAGGASAEIHNVFSLLTTKVYHQISTEYDRDKRPFILTRTGTAGIQKYGAAIWSGDVFSDYQTYSAHIPEALNAGVSGISLWTCDGGGFISSTSNALDNRNLYKNDIGAHALLYERWLQFSCFSPIMRAHHAGESAPFAFNEITAEGVRRYIRLRYYLLPYIYSYQYRCSFFGTPVMRPLIYEYPSDPELYNCKDEYLFGKELLIAPVTEEKKSSRRVYLPEGKWYDWDYGYEYEGKESYEVYAPQNRIPVFIKAGAIIPVADSIMHTRDWDCHNLKMLIYPNRESEFTVYTDDGCSMQYEAGDYTLTKVKVIEKVRSVQILLEKNNLRYAPSSGDFLIFSVSVPQAVIVNGQELNRVFQKGLLRNSADGYYYDSFQGLLEIKTALKNELNDFVEITFEKECLIQRTKGREETNKGAGQLPFLFPASSLPCNILAVNFDRGGEGIAYHKEVPGNEAGIYRSESVIITPCEDEEGECSYQITDMTGHEWLEYTVDVKEAGYFQLDIRYRTKEETVVSFSVNSQNQKGYIPINSDVWDTLQVEDVFMAKGEQIFRIDVMKGKMDISRIIFKEKRG